jgi:glyoxylase I family protein
MSISQDLLSPHVHGVRYQTHDIARSIEFYTRVLGFTLKYQHGSAFATVTCDGLDLLLSGPASSGAKAMADGQQQVPGGWNRLVLRIDNLSRAVESLKAAGVRFRNDVVAGPGGQQIQVLDPDGNPIELFEPASATTS